MVEVGILAIAAPWLLAFTHAVPSIMEGDELDEATMGNLCPTSLPLSNNGGSYTLLSRQPLKRWYVYLVVLQLYHP